MALAQNSNPSKASMIMLLVISIALAVFAIILVFSNIRVSGPPKEITNYEECVAAGGGIILTYPGKCELEDGRIFEEESETNSSETN